MSIDFYKEFGELGYLANYSSHGFYKNDIYYKTVEHYYQSEKFDDLEIKTKIINCDTPKEASNIGRDRNLKRIDNFKSIKLDVMYDGLIEKFRQNKDIRSKLIETGDSLIREMTTKENYWGIGPNLDGENHIGILLMKVRDTVKKEVLDIIISNCKGKDICVVGHNKPDMDSVVSSLILTNILKSLGINANACVRDKNFVDSKFINDFINTNELNELDTNSYYILVDHNNLNGLDKDKVLGSIDHHIITNEVEDLIEIEYASCALLIYDLFKDTYKFNNKEKELIGLSVLSDTEFLTSSRVRELDKKLFATLNFKLDLDYLKGEYLFVNDFDKDIKDNMLLDYKEYNYNNVNINRSMLKGYSDDINKFYDLYINNMNKYNINLLIFIDYSNLITYFTYKNIKYKFPYFTTSTNLIIKYLDENNVL